MQALTDMHCHLLPYVDDGAENLQQAVHLLNLQVEQNVSTVFLTPHYRKGMFETADDKIEAQYNRLLELTQKSNLPLTLYLGREYYIGKSFLEKLAQGNVFPLGNSKHILIEFSTRPQEKEVLLKYVNAILSTGYTPLIAHVERYPITKNEPEILNELHELGAKLQMNAEVFLGNGGFWHKRYCMQLIKKYPIDFIASDSHDINMRTPNLGDCANYLKKKLPNALWQKIFIENPKILL